MDRLKKILEMGWYDEKEYQNEKLSEDIFSKIVNFEELKGYTKFLGSCFTRSLTLEESNKHIVSFPVMETNQTEIYLEREHKFLKFFSKLLQVEQPYFFCCPEEGPDPSKIFRFVVSDSLDLFTLGLREHFAATFYFEQHDIYLVTRFDLELIVYQGGKTLAVKLLESCGLNARFVD